jgi:hypothetical protein
VQKKFSTVGDGSALELKKQPTSATGEDFPKSNVEVNHT